MNLKFIARLYGCFFYEVIIQVALWFLITLIILVSLGDSYTINSSLLGFILWLSSGTYFIYSWVNGSHLSVHLFQLLYFSQLGYF
jgi:hypothetical protein